MKRRTASSRPYRRRRSPRGRPRKPKSREAAAQPDLARLRGPRDGGRLRARRAAHVRLIITIPFGIASARIALFCVWPFGRTLVRRPDAGAGSLLGNVIWFVLAGWWLAIGHLITGVLMCLTIVGIPLGLANFKLIPVSLTPFGRDIVDIDEARRLGIQPALAMPADPSA